MTDRSKELKASLKETYVSGFKLEVCKMLLHLHSLLKNELETSEISDIYVKRLEFDEYPPMLLKEAHEKVGKLKALISKAMSNVETVMDVFEDIWKAVVAANYSVKKFNVHGVHKCDRTDMEDYLCQEITKLSELDIQPRVVESYFVQAEREENSEDAIREREEQERVEAERKADRLALREEEDEQDRKEVQEIQDKRSRLKQLVRREILPTRQKVKEVDQFMEFCTTEMKCTDYPQPLETRINFWRKNFMNFLDTECRKGMTAIFKRQVKK